MEQAERTVKYPIEFDHSGKVRMDLDDYVSKMKMLLDFSPYQRIGDDEYGTFLSSLEQKSPASVEELLPAHLMHLRESVARNIPEVTIYSLSLMKSRYTPREIKFILMISTPNKDSVQEVKYQPPLATML